MLLDKSFVDMDPKSRMPASEKKTCRGMPNALQGSF